MPSVHLKLGVTPVPSVHLKLGVTPVPSVHLKLGVTPVPSVHLGEIKLGITPVPSSMKMLQIQNGFFQGAQDSLHCYRFYFCL